MLSNILFLPLISAFIVGISGRKIGITGTNILVIGTLLISTIMSITLSYEIIIAGSSVSLEPLLWLDTSKTIISWGFSINPLNAWLISTVLSISLLVHIFASSYMSGDPNPQKFMSLLLAFTGFMVLLIGGDNLGVLFFGYEGSYFCLKWLLSFNFIFIFIIMFTSIILKRFFYTNKKIPSTTRIGPHEKRVISIIIGTLMGDSHLEKRVNEKGYRVIFEQNSRNVEYLMWLHQFFSVRGYCNPVKPSLRTRIKKDNTVYRFFRFTTFSFSSFNWLYEHFYSVNFNHFNLNKVIPFTLLEEYLNEESLAIWFMDDGSKLGSGFKIATSGFEYDEVFKL